MLHETRVAKAPIALCSRAPRRAYRNLLLRCAGASGRVRHARAWAVRSPISGSSWPAEKSGARVPGRAVRRGRSVVEQRRPIAAFHRAALAGCGTFADERRVAAGGEGAEVYWRRARPRSRCAPRASRMTSLHTGALIGTFRRVAPSRGGAFADGRRIVAGDEGRREY
jgi:hypothetical protein